MTFTEVQVDVNLIQLHGFSYHAKLSKYSFLRISIYSTVSYTPPRGSALSMSCHKEGKVIRLHVHSHSPADF